MNLDLDHLNSTAATALRDGPIPNDPKSAPPESSADRAQRFRFLADDVEAVASRIRAAGAPCTARSLETEANRLRVSARAVEMVEHDSIDATARRARR